MIKGVGIDMIEVARVANSIKKESFKHKVFTSSEIEYCERQGIPTQHYAARFAAKEAFFKALGIGWRGKLEFFEVEVANDDLGKPFLNLYGTALTTAQKMGINHIHLSLTHLKSTAAAVVVLEA